MTMNPPPDPFPSVLTKRELDVVIYICKGLSAKDIGRMLDISDKTIESSMGAIRRKLDVSKNTEVAVWATKHGLV